MILISSFLFRLYRLTRILLVFFCFIGTLSAQAPGRTEKSILEVMDLQETAWNRGDLAGFMAGYWHSDSLRFIGSRGLTYGWEEILHVYQKGYPDQAAMGKLTFTVFSIEKLNRRTAFVVGKWHLDRKNGELSGHYTLLWKKIKGKWVIVADHSS